MISRARRAFALSATALAVALSTISCAEAGRQDVPEGYVPPRPATVTVTMSEYRFVFARRLPPGRVVFKVVNGGQLPHRLSLLALPDGSPPIGELVKAPGGLTIAPMAQMPELAPGGAGGSFAVDLQPGRRYAMVSLRPSPDGTPEALLGMVAEIRTSGAAVVQAPQSP